MSEIDYEARADARRRMAEASRDFMHSYEGAEHMILTGFIGIAVGVSPGNKKWISYCFGDGSEASGQADDDEQTKVGLYEWELEGMLRYVLRKMLTTETESQ